MGLRKVYVLGVISGLMLVACAGLGFSYKYYGMQLVSYENGKLLGPTEKDDLPVSVCAPDAASQGKCVVLMANEFFRLKADFMSLEQQLSDLQKQCPK